MGLENFGIRTPATQGLKWNSHNPSFGLTLTKGFSRYIKLLRGGFVVPFLIYGALYRVFILQ